MTSPTRLAGALAAGALLALPATAQDSFTIVGDGRVVAVSSDGDVLAGFDSFGPVLWSAGLVLPLGSSEQIVDISEAGIFGAGTADDNGLGGDAPHRLDNFAWLSLGSLGQGGCPNFGTSYAMSDDATVITGLAWNGCKTDAFIWTPFSGMQSLPKLGTESARANAISGDGNFAGGWDRVNSGNNKASFWTVSGGAQQLILQGLPGNPDGVGEIWGISEDGDWVCGKQGFNGDDAFRWSQATGPELIGFIPSIGGAATMEAIRGDGAHCIGWQGSSGPFGGVISATTWTETAGMQTLEQWCADRGLALPTALLPAGNPLSFAVDMTDDGGTIVGYSGAGFGVPQTAWRIDVDLTWTGLGSGLDGVSGQPLLGGAGDLTPGSSGSLTIANGAPSAAAGLFVAVGANTPVPFKGGTLEAFPFVNLFGFATDTNGDASFPWASWPAGVPTGTDLTFQAAIQDGAASAGFALTNGITATAP